MILPTKMVIDNQTQVQKGVNFFNILIISGNWDWIQFFQALAALKKRVFINIQGKLIRYEPLTNFI